jgi:hypothetical protein
MGTTGNSKLPDQMSSCVRLFIESLLDEVGCEDGRSRDQTHKFQSPLREAPEKDHQLTT